MDLLNCDMCGDSIHLDDVKLLGTYWMHQYYCKECYKDLILREYIKLWEESK